MHDRCFNDVIDFVIARNPDEDSSLPFLVRLPLGRDGIALKVRETWPRTSRFTAIAPMTGLTTST